MRLKISEPAPARADAMLRRITFSTTGGWVGIASVSATGGVIATWIFNQRDLAGQVIAAVIGVVAGGATFLLGFYSALLIRVGFIQRDEARNRLRQIAQERSSYSLVADEARSIPEDGGDVLQLKITNVGRASRFAALLTGIDGAEQELVDPFTLLYWMGRKGVTEEEIPREESRLVGVGQLLTTLTARKKPKTLRFVPRAPDGSRWLREYTIRPGVPLVIRVMVSARGDPDMGFTQEFEIQIKWAGPDKEIFIGLVRPGPSPRTHPQDRFNQLFDYD